MKAVTENYIKLSKNVFRKGDYQIMLTNQNFFFLVLTKCRDDVQLTDSRH